MKDLRVFQRNMFFDLSDIQRFIDFNIFPD